jgi:hypothetical protein
LKTRVFHFRLEATKMFTPELDKGERNPYTSGHEIGNPYMQDINIKIEDDDANELLEWLRDKGYNTSKFM